MHPAGVPCGTRRLSKQSCGGRTQCVHPAGVQCGTRQSRPVETVTACRGVLCTMPPGCWALEVETCGHCMQGHVLMLVLVRKATNWLFASFETNTSRSLEPFRSERKCSVFGFVSEPKGNRVSYCGERVGGWAPKKEG